jgi:hypothetical protein
MPRIYFILFYFFQFATIWAQSNDAVLVYQKTDITVEKYKLNKTLHFELKVLNRNGEKFTTVTIPYSKMIKVSKIEGLVKDENGIIIKKLNKNDIKERSYISANSFYEDDFIKEFTLKHNEYPYTIIYSYQVQQDEFLYIDYWRPILDEKISTKKATLNINIPKEYKISYYQKDIDNFKIDSTSVRKTLSWNTSYNNYFEFQPFSPPIETLFPTVVVIPVEFKYDLIGSFKNWQTYGNWQYELLQGLSDLPQIEKNKISTLIFGVENIKEKIKILYHYLQDETRYINITIATGGLKPYPASYVAKNKYGDCKALTNYFKSLLDFIGVESFYTKVYAGSPIKEINKILPSQQFNHVILCVPIQKDTLWLDCTSDGPFNTLGTFTQNRDVLIIDKNNSHFTKTPTLLNKDVLETRVIKFLLNKQNETIANFENNYRGANYESLFQLSHSFNESEKSQLIKKYYIENSFESIDFKMVETHRDSTKIQLSYSAKTDKIYRKYGNETIIKLIPFSIPSFKDPKYRTLPVQLDYPIYKIDSIEYPIPSGHQITNQLKNKMIANKFGEYKIEFFQKNQKLIVTKSFLLNAGYYGLDEYPNFYAFINSIDEIENNTYIATIKQE